MLDCLSIAERPRPSPPGQHLCITFNVASGIGRAIGYHSRSFPSLQAPDAEPVQEMGDLVRVASKTVFIPDRNVYDMGYPFTRGEEQHFRNLNTRWLLRLPLTGSKGYHLTTEVLRH
jgi:hypothetical protein